MSSSRTEIQQLIRQAQAEPTLGNMRRASLALRKLDTAALGDPEVRERTTVRIGVLSSFVVDPLVDALRISGWSNGLNSEFYVGGYDQYHQELLNHASPLYSFRPDIVFLAVELPSLLPVLRQRELRLQDVGDVMTEVTSLVSAFKRNSEALLVLFNFVLFDEFPFRASPDEARISASRLNEQLALEYNVDPQIAVLDYEGLAGYFGRERVREPKLWHLARMGWGEQFIPSLAEKCLAYVRALKGLTRKVLVLDLDNTTWGGIVGEDGFENIHVEDDASGRPYRELQQVVLDLYRRGVVLAVNSKNNYADAIQVLREHPGMLLKEEHFASLQINWNDKVANMHLIAEELHLGVDSFVFVDDNPFERAQMRDRLPEVYTVELPDDPSLFPKTLRSLSLFEQLRVTEEDHHRGEQYAAERARKDLEHTSVSVEDFLFKLDIKLEIRLASQDDIPRLSQLTQRTNQFNLTTHRFSEAQLATMRADPCIRIYTLRCDDIYGDNGLVALAIIRQRDNAWDIDTILMSCRVFGRKIETALISMICADAQGLGIRYLHGEYIPTKKNQLVQGFYRDHHFKVIGRQGDHTSWRLDIQETHLEIPPWFTIRRA